MWGCAGPGVRCCIGMIHDGGDVVWAAGAVGGGGGGGVGDGVAPPFGKHLFQRAQMMMATQIETMT